MIEQITAEQHTQLERLIALGKDWNDARIALEVATERCRKARAVFQEQMQSRENRDLYYSTNLREVKP